MRITVEPTQANYEADYLEDPGAVYYTTSSAVPTDDDLDAVQALELAIAALVAWGYDESHFKDVLELIRK